MHVYNGPVLVLTWLHWSFFPESPALCDSGWESAEREVCRRCGKKKYISSLYSPKSVVKYNDQDTQGGGRFYVVLTLPYPASRISPPGSCWPTAVLSLPLGPLWIPPLATISEVVAVRLPTSPLQPYSGRWVCLLGFPMSPASSTCPTAPVLRRAGERHFSHFPRALPGPLPPNLLPSLCRFDSHINPLFHNIRSGSAFLTGCWELPHIHVLDVYVYVYLLHRMWSKLSDGKVEFRFSPWSLSGCQPAAPSTGMLSCHSLAHLGTKVPSP